MNPRLYQAMDLLYLPLLELEQHLKQELTANPFLEMSEPEEEFEAQEEEVEEPTEEDEEIDWEEVLLDGFDSGYRSGSNYEDIEAYERVPQTTIDLWAHLLHQLYQSNGYADGDIRIGEEIIGVCCYRSPSGWGATAWRIRSSTSTSRRYRPISITTSRKRWASRRFASR